MMLPNVTEHGSIKFTCKGPDRYILGFAGYVVSVTNIQPGHVTLKQSISKHVSLSVFQLHFIYRH